MTDDKTPSPCSRCDELEKRLSAMEKRLAETTGKVEEVKRRVALAACLPVGAVDSEHTGNELPVPPTRQSKRPMNNGLLPLTFL